MLVFTDRCVLITIRIQYRSLLLFVLNFIKNMDQLMYMSTIVIFCLQKVSCKILLHNI